MCEACNDDTGAVSRRRFLALGVVGAPLFLWPRRAIAQGLNSAAIGAAIPPTQVTPWLAIHPRRSWAGGLRARGPLKPEPNVKFLLVHHTAGSTFYSKDQVPSVIQSIFRFHTGARKNWPDTCYNFFVDRFGGVWEGRTGSLAGPVMADATGGSQGFAQLVCLLGNFEKYEPPKEMIDGLSRLLAWMGHEYNVELNQSKKVTFISRGSNKWKKGVVVRARPISGHRDMSQTACPGKNVYPLLVSDVPARARAYAKRFPT